MIIRGFFPISVILLLIAVGFNCSINVADGGSEAGNANVIGAIINEDGKPADNTLVQFIREDYNPVFDGPLPDSLTTITDSTGIFSFYVTDTGTFNIQAHDLTLGTRLFIADIEHYNDTTILPLAILRKPGAVKMFLPDTVNTVNGYVYMAGTTVMKRLAETATLSEESVLFIDSLPTAIFPGMFYDVVNDPHEPILCSDTFIVASNDTVITEAFVFWANNKQVNSGLPGDSILDIYKEPDGTLWIAVGEGGVAKFDGTGWTVYNKGNSQIPANNVYEITRDSTGLMWFATRQGVTTFDGSTWTTYNADNSNMPGYFTTSLGIDSKGVMWFGMFNDGLVRYDGFQFTVYDTNNSDIADDNITHLDIDASDNIWCASSKGAIKFDGTSWTVYNTGNSGIFADKIYCVKIDRLGEMWFSHINGVSKFNGAAWSTFDASHSSMLGTVVLSLCDDRYGNLWVGTQKGLTMYDGVQWLDYEGERWLLLNDINVYVVYIDNNDDKWLGTYTKGVIGFGPTVK